jgi:hypothetical protein
MSERLTLTITAARHPASVDNDNPSIANRQIGFQLTAELRSTNRASSTLQEKYKLEQFVKDKYWISTRPSDTSDVWTDGPWNGSGDTWVLDSFGFDAAEGEWNSTQVSTIFLDEPGFLGTTGQHAQALPKTQRLGYYEASFKWKVTNELTGDSVETEVITFIADPNDDHSITYTIPLSRVYSFDL